MHEIIGEDANGVGGKKSQPKVPTATKIGKEDLLPLDILTYKDFKKESFDTFNQAADEFYTERLVQISRRSRKMFGQKK